MNSAALQPVSIMAFTGLLEVTLWRTEQQCCPKPLPQTDDVVTMQGPNMHAWPEHEGAPAIRSVSNNAGSDSSTQQPLIHPLGQPRPACFSPGYQPA